MKRLIITLIFFTLSIPSFSQDDYSNSVFLEAGGNSPFISLCYERLFKQNYTARVSTFYIKTPYSETLTIPISVGGFFGKRNHHLEGALGITHFTYFGDVKDHRRDFVHFSGRNILYSTVYIGYRFQRPNKRFLLRTGLTYLHRVYDNEEDEREMVWPFWPGVSVGYRFNFTKN